VVTQEVPMLDLRGLYERQQRAIDAAICRVVHSQRFIGGPEVTTFEAAVGAYLASERQCVGCASGSDAIILALRALEIGPGDEVVVPVYSFTSTATSVDVVGARPVFVDVDDQALNLDPSQIESALSSATRAVIAVHLFGRMADVPAIRRALDSAGRQDVVIIEDCAQSFGARLDGRPACTWGALATLSFFPSKNLGAYGDGGMVVAADASCAETLRLLRSHGARRKYDAELIGYNSRLDAIQAAVLGVKLGALDAWCVERRECAARYRQLFAESRISEVRLPADDGPASRFFHTYNQFNLRVQSRDQLRAHLSAQGVASSVYYPRTLAQQTCYAARRLDDGLFPVANAARKESLAIPIYPGLEVEVQKRIVNAISQFYRG